MNILIIGGLSHLATNFILLHRNKFKYVVVIDKVSYCSQSKENIKMLANKVIWMDAVNVDIENVVVFHNIDCIFNAAASTHVDKSYEDISIFSNDNIKLVCKLMETIVSLKKLNKQVKLLHMSTDEVYGDDYKDNNSGNRSEQDYLSPTNPYSATKASGDMIINSYCYSYNLWKDIIVLRPNNLAGFFQYPDKIIPLFYNKIKNNKDVYIHGLGQQKRCFISTKIVCDIILVLLTNNIKWDSSKYKSVFYNVGYNCQNGVKVIDIFHIVKNLVNVDYTANYIISEDRPYNDKIYRICNKKIINLLSSFEKNILIDKILISMNETSEDAIKQAIDEYEYMNKINNI